MKILGRTMRWGAFICSSGVDDSLAEFGLALSLNPNFALTQSVYAFALALCGDWEKADTAARHALRLSPRDPFSALIYGIAACAQFVGHNYEETMRLARTSIRLCEDHAPGHRMLNAAAAVAGEADVAAAALQTLLRAQPEFSLAWIANNIPFKRNVDREHYLDAVRRAGLE